MLPRNLGEVGLLSHLPMSYPDSTALSCETCLKIVLFFLSALAPWSYVRPPRNSSQWTCLSPVNTHSHRPWEPSALISLDHVAARKPVVAARGSVQCASVLWPHSPPRLHCLPFPVPCAVVIQADVSVVYQGCSTWLLPIFPQDSAQASLVGILSRSAGWTGLTLTVTILCWGGVLLSR